MNKILLTFCLCLLIFQVNAQQIWKKGFIVRESGDTLKGEVLFKDWERSPTEFSFRRAEGQPIREFTPDSLSDFFLLEPKVQYVSKPITLKYYSRSPVDDNDNAVTEEFSGNAFLEILLRSESVILYSYVDKEREERFFIEKNNQLTELLNIVYRKNVDGVLFEVKRPYYKNQLKALLGECPTLNTSNVEYQAKAIVKLLKSYHNYCRIDYHLTFERENNEDLIDLGVSLGINQNTYPSYFGLAVQIRSKKNFHNQFALLELGRASRPEVAYNQSNPFLTGTVNTNVFYFGFYGGSYFGAKKLRPCLFTGMSSLNGMFDTGGGIAYKQKIAFTFSTPIFSLGNYSIKFRWLL